MLLRGWRSYIYRLIEACAGGEDPVQLVQQAGRDHIPALPTNREASPSKYPPDASARLPMPEIIEELKAEYWYRDQIVDHRSSENRDPQLGWSSSSVWAVSLTPHSGELSTPLSDSIKKGLQDARSITRFYSHQAAAINAIAEGKHVIVSTATASGKSVIYQVPVLRYLEEDKDSTAIYIYPTKVCFVI